MAKQVITRLVDDLDGSDAAETITFSLDGVEHQIDLSEEHVKALREAFRPFIEAGTRVRASGRPVLRVARTDRQENSRIRQWARSQGYDISERGRIAADVVEAYRKAA